MTDPRGRQEGFLAANPIVTNGMAAPSRSTLDLKSFEESNAPGRG